MVDTEKILDLERFLSETERQHNRTAKELAGLHPDLASKFARLAKETHAARLAVVQTAAVQSVA